MTSTVRVIRRTACLCSVITHLRGSHVPPRCCTTPGCIGSRRCWFGNWTAGGVASHTAFARSRNWRALESGSSARTKVSTRALRAPCRAFFCTYLPHLPKWSAKLSGSRSGPASVPQKPRERAWDAHRAYSDGLMRRFAGAGLSLAGNRQNAGIPMSHGDRRVPFGKPSPKLAARNPRNRTA